MSRILAVFSTLGLRYTTAAGLSQYAEAAAGRWARYAVAVVMVAVGIPARRRQGTDLPALHHQPRQHLRPH
jgi:hypothetical protein